MSADNKIKVLLVKVMERPQVVEIADDLKEMQRLVDGYIQEIMPFDDDVALICNEEGKIRGLLLNRAVRDEEGEIVDIIAGDFFLCSAPIESERFQSLSDEQIEKYQEMFQHPEQFFMREDGIGVRRARLKEQEFER